MTKKRLWLRIISIVYASLLGSSCSFSSPIENNFEKTETVINSDSSLVIPTIEEASIRVIASKFNLNCISLDKNLSKAKANAVGFKELYKFVSEECSGKEPPIPRVMPAHCVDQVLLSDPQSVAIAPGVTLEQKDILEYNLGHCRCPVEYQLQSVGQRPFCARQVQVPS